MSVPETGFLKCPTGIRGFDEITFGGIPRGRSTLIGGPAGSGKTLMAMEFLVRGAVQFNEPGVFIAFEETAEELTQNMVTLGFDLDGLSKENKILLDYVRIERSEILESGEYDLEGLFIRLNHAIDSIGAKRVVLDTIESLFSGVSNEAILRAELRRLFSWLKTKGVTAIITAEKGERTLTRFGLEEYVSDCVIILDHWVANQIGTRRMRIVKYRGSQHGTNEYPFIIDEHGVAIMPITSIGLTYHASSERISSGIPRLDNMLGGKGFFRGSSVLISGAAGTGKTTFAASFADSVCQRGEKCLFFTFEESPNQIMRNMLSVGINLEPWVKKGLLQIHAIRSTFYGLETHLVTMQKLVEEFKPYATVIDPITNLINVGEESDVKSMLTRLIDFLKGKQITALLTNLSHASFEGSTMEQTEAGVSSLMDTWIVLRDIETSGERNRGIYVIKSRGMDHSNQIREFLLTKKGVEIIDTYLGPTGMLTGSARAAQEAVEKAEEVAEREAVDQMQSEIDRKRKLMEAQVLALQDGFKSEEAKIKQIVGQKKLREKARHEDRQDMAHLRKSDNK